MAEYKITVDQKLMPYIEALSKLRGISIEEVLSTVVNEQLLSLIKERESFDGLFDGPGDLSERDEEYLYGKRQDD
jgi:hypothetical protein